ncbi:MAG TPA: hypothetical protein VKF32_02755, partial [Thermoanaerobaculia bacterium]|nr:hypothetical protein [Thermoanaerobaculia bacterium]
FCLAAILSTVAARPCVAVPFLLLTKTTNNGGTASAGDIAVFVLTLQNTGNASAMGVILTDTLPAGLAWGTGTTGCSIDSMTRVLTCSAGTIPASGGFVAIVTAPTDASKCGSYPNTASATSTNANSPTSNMVTLTVGCGAFRVVQLPDVTRVKPGDPLGFRIAVHNFGNGTARGVTLTDQLPAGLSWSLLPSTAGCGVDGNGLILCALGDLAPGAGAALHVVSATTAQTCGTFAGNPQASATNGPVGSITDADAAKVLPVGDQDFDCAAGVSDVFHLINFLFAGGPAPL